MRKALSAALAVALLIGVSGCANIALPLGPNPGTPSNATFAGINASVAALK